MGLRVTTRKKPVDVFTSFTRNLSSTFHLPINFLSFFLGNYLIILFSGEDPFLSGQYGTAYTIGLQNGTLDSR